MVFIVDENNKVARVLDENSAAHRPIIIDTRCFVLRRLVERVDADVIVQPAHVCLVYFLHLMVFTVKVAKDLDYASLYLQL